MALNSKRTQTFFNEFLITTTQFLNQFMTDCESKFFEFERKLNRIESNLVIIEAKLASVPDEQPSNLAPSVAQNPPQPSSTDTQKPQESTSKPQDDQSKPKEDQLSQSTPESNQNQEQSQTQTQPVVENSNLIKISESFLYKKFFKMVKFGIPPPAVKIKMNSEGLDGNLLDNPDLMIDKCPEDDEEVEE